MLVDCGIRMGASFQSSVLSPLVHRCCCHYCIQYADVVDMKDARANNNSTHVTVHVTSNCTAAKLEAQPLQPL